MNSMLFFTLKRVCKMFNCDFTYSHYESILDLIIKAEYKAIFFNDSGLYARELIIRHDIDVDLNKAYQMALIENKHNIRATYLIMLRSPFYNIFDRSNSDYIEGILDLGHQIGLHFDEAYYSSDDMETIINNVDSEARILRDNFNTGIYVVSFHRPSQFILQSDVKLKDLINTYDRSLLKKFKYISDSRHMWKEGCLCSFFDKTGTDCSVSRIQALIHPIWWADKDLGAMAEMVRFLLNKLKVFDNELEKNIQIYNTLF